MVSEETRKQINALMEGQFESHAKLFQETLGTEDPEIMKKFDKLQREGVNAYIQILNMNDLEHTEDRMSMFVSGYFNGHIGHFLEMLKETGYIEKFYEATGQ